MPLKESILRPFAGRFFAGETLEDGLARAAEVNRMGMGVTLDYLGEDVAVRAEAAAALAEYTRIIHAVAGRGLDASVAVKLTHIGLAVDRTLASEGALALGALAAEKGVGLWLDMEGSVHTRATLDIYRAVRGVCPDAGVALQAYLHRTWDDLKALAAEGATIRLVKGAYDEPPELAAQAMSEIRARFAAMMEHLFRHAGRFAVATHDKGLVGRALELAGTGRAGLEFQMLMGMRDDLKARLVSGGHRVVEYVPYGRDWYGYGMRRLTEKRRNALYFLEGLFGR